MDSTGAACYLIHLSNFPKADNIQSDSLDNSITSERLVITGIDQPYEPVAIARDSIQANGEWIEEMRKNLDNEYRNIVLML
jgi:hypothetical protein